MRDFGVRNKSAHGQRSVSSRSSLLFCLLLFVATTCFATGTAYAATVVTLPDMKILVPTNAISIGTDPSTNHRMLRYTHVTWDAGTGPFELDPTYNPATGTSSFVQAIYNSSAPGVWSLDHTVTVPTMGVFDSPSDYRFPLTKFTLNTVGAGGTLGAVVAASPKTDYCITGDVIVGGVANTPNQTYIPATNCDDPAKPLGWSVGWGDQYDQTDSGQPIDLTGVPDGAYILHATVDPQHVLTEADKTNNVTDTQLQITGGTVTVLSQASPVTVPPSVSVTSPSAGASLSGTVALQASAAATAPATVVSAQFLLDGQALGGPTTTAPYSYSWNVGSTSLGVHSISAQVTDSAGNIATATSVPINVVSGGVGVLGVDSSAMATGSASVSVALATHFANETLIAFVAGDGPTGGGQSAAVTGAGLAWSLVKRTNVRLGDA